MNRQLGLEFIPHSPESFVDACSRLLLGGKRKIRLRPFNQFATEFLKKASSTGLKAEFQVVERDCELPVPKNVSLGSVDEEADATLLFHSQGQVLAASLLEHLDLDQGVVVAPMTDYYYKNKPVFLISIPKSGTHLLYELVRAFGYRPGIVCTKDPSPGYWYCIEYSNPHTPARDFFIDTLRRSNFGNRDHPFLKSPAIFIYRNPLDIVLSETRYYHKDGNTAFYSYLSHLSFEERLLKLIDDPWLLGSILDRVGDFAAWLDFKNVIPISFEELVGPNGGGDPEIQRKLIWSLQLKLQVPGDPVGFGKRIFNPESPTFAEGQIGAYKKYFTPEAYQRFGSLPQAAMRFFGYDFGDSTTRPFVPRRAEEFRRRPVGYSQFDFDNTPIEVEFNYLGCNIVRYQGGYHVIPRFLGEIDLSDSTRVGFKKFFISICPDLNTAKQTIIAGGSIFRLFYWRKWAGKIWATASRLLTPRQVF